MIETKNELQTLFSYLFALVRNPVQEIQNLPEIRWKTLIIFQFCLNIISVVLSNVLAPYAISMVNITISVVASVLALTLSSLFFYYFFLILYNRQLPFIKIFSLVLFANIPFVIFHIAAFFFPPADLIGLAISALLMVVGLVENFQVPKKLATQLIIGLYFIFFLYWAGNLIVSRDHSESSLPQDLDKIEKEVNDTFNF